MANFVIDPKFKQGMSTVKNLNPALLLKVNNSQISPSLAAAILDNTAGNPASTKALVEVNAKADLNTQKINTLIDDTAVVGTGKTWSIDQIKAYVAEEDDTYFAATITERDDDTVGIIIPKRQGVRVFIADASTDANVGTDANGVPFGAYYIYNGTAWILIRSLAYRQVDVTPYVRYTDVVDDLASTQTNKPLSANQGRELALLIATGNASLRMAVDDVVVGAGGVIPLSMVARGEATNGMSFVITTEGIIPVFVTMATDGKSATIIEDDATLYEGQTARISYLTDGEIIPVATATVAGDGTVVP